MSNRPVYSTPFRWLATAAAFAAVFAFALTCTVIPAAANQVRAELCHGSYALLAYIYPIWMAGYFIFVFAGGHYSDRRGKLPVLCAAGVLMAIGSIGVTLARGYYQALGSVFVLGIGGGLAEATSSAVIAVVHSARRRTSMMNLTQVFFAAGAVIGPVLGVSLLLRHDIDWRWAMVATAAFCVLGGAIALAALLKREEKISPQAHAGRWRPLLADRMLIVLAAGVMLYVGAETGQADWLAAYFRHNLRSAPDLSAATVGIFWGGIGAGRAVTTWVARHASDYVLIMCSHGFGLLIQIVLLLVNSADAALFTVPLLGLALGPVWPTIVSRASHLHERQTGAVLAIVIAAGALGAGVFAPAIGQVAVWTGLRAALWICPALLLINLAMFTILWARNRVRPEAR